MGRVLDLSHPRLMAYLSETVQHITAAEGEGSYDDTSDICFC